MPPPGAGVETATIAVPAVAMAACKLVLETNVVARAFPFHCRVDEETKFVPVRLSVNAGPTAVAELGFSGLVASEGLGLGGGVVILLPPPPAQPIRLVRAAAHSRYGANSKNSDRKHRVRTAALRDRLRKSITPKLL